MTGCGFRGAEVESHPSGAVVVSSPFPSFFPGDLAHRIRSGVASAIHSRASPLPLAGVSSSATSGNWGNGSEDRGERAAPGRLAYGASFARWTAMRCARASSSSVAGEVTMVLSWIGGPQAGGGGLRRGGHAILRPPPDPYLKKERPQANPEARKTETKN